MVYGRLTRLLNARMPGQKRRKKSLAARLRSVFLDFQEMLKIPFVASSSSLLLFRRGGFLARFELYFFGGIEEEEDF